MRIPLEAFAAYGIELEYMLVDRESLDVRPIADLALAEITEDHNTCMANGVAAANASKVPISLAWSNELVLHVLEVKNPFPRTLSELGTAFQAQIEKLDARLAAFDACLMPTAMHPWMDPAHETALWPHHDHAIYATFDQLFNCRRHPWSNIQSMHVNLPFADDTQFEKLLAATRLLLPVLPAIAASSPLAEGAATGYMDYRMHVYRDQSPACPHIVGAVIPEVVRSRGELEQQILAPMYADIAPGDPAQHLRFEWLNARGVIPRFDRSALEIRVLDMQECPQADLALAALIVDLTQWLYAGEIAPLSAQQALSTSTLSGLLCACNRNAEQTVIADANYLNVLGFPGKRCSAQELWYYLGETLLSYGAHHLKLWQSHLRIVLQHGPLARRIMRALAGQTSRAALRTVYARLVDNLRQGTPFLA